MHDVFHSGEVIEFGKGANKQRFRACTRHCGLNNVSTLRKLRMEHEYFRRLGKTNWKIVTQHELSKLRAQNILALLGSRILEDFGINAATAVKVRKFRQAHLLDYGSLSDFTKACDVHLGLPRNESLAVARHLIATLKWCWDMSVFFGIERAWTSSAPVPTLKKAA